MQIQLEGSFPFLFPMGKVLSFITLVLVVAAIWNVWRRKSFPGVAYGGVSLSPRRLRWVWFTALLAAFGFGINEDPVTVSTSLWEDPEAAAAVTASRTVTVNLPLPFYSYDREKVYGDGELVRDYLVEGFVLPWPLISALVAYLVLVVRWKPENRWARHILQGRKWQVEENSESD